MAQPPVYNRQYSFASYQALNPAIPLPGSEVDLELNAVKTTLDAVLADLALIQNDDTTVKNASIGPAQLSSHLTTGFTAPSAWVTGTAYTASPASTVLQSTSMYICLVSHTSGTFATDLAAGKWLKIFDLSTLTFGTASQITVSAHGSDVVTNVQTSLNNLEDNKAATSHTHPASQISDSTADGRAFLTANLASQKTLLGLGALAFLNSVSVTAIAAQLAFTPKIGPFTLSSGTSDWAPTGYATAIVVQANVTSNMNLNSFIATSDGDIKIIDNVGTNTMTMMPAGNGGASANAFSLPKPYPVRPGQSVIIKYDGANSLWRVQTPVSTNPPAGATFKNLMIGNGAVTLGNYSQPGTPNSHFLVTYDELTLEDANGETWTVKNGSHTIDTSVTNGVNGLESAFSLTSAKIFVWVIAKPSTNTVSALMSLSATSPTLPSGYTFKARVGATFTDGSNNLRSTFQAGRRVSYIADGTHPLPTMASGATGSTPTATTFTPASVTITSFVPTTATVIRFLTGASNTGSTAVIALAPNTNYSGSGTTTPAPFWLSITASNLAGYGEMNIEGTTIQAAGNFALFQLLAVGWDDNL